MSNERGYTKTHASVTEGGSAVTRYQDVVVGTRSVKGMLYFEFCAWLAPMPGATGLFLRRVFWPRLLGSCGKSVVFGANVLLRHPHRIHIGNEVVIGEGCILDARNKGNTSVIVVEDDVMLANNVMISCKDGTVEIGCRTGISAQSIIQSVHGNRVAIGADCIIGPQCYIVGGSNYHFDRADIPIWRQGIAYDGGVILGENVWLGAKVTVLGGVRMGEGSIAAAGAVVTKPIPAGATCAGLPAEVKRMREKWSVGASPLPGQRET